jgi:hypothetical protein
MTPESLATPKNIRAAFRTVTGTPSTLTEARKAGDALGRRIAADVRAREIETGRFNAPEVIEIVLEIERYRGDDDGIISQVADAAAQAFRKERGGGRTSPDKRRVYERSAGRQAADDRVVIEPGCLVHVLRGLETGRARVLHQLGLNGQGETIWAVQMLGSNFPIPVPESGLSRVSEKKSQVFVDENGDASGVEFPASKTSH